MSTDSNSSASEVSSLEIEFQKFLDDLSKRKKIIDKKTTIRDFIDNASKWSVNSQFEKSLFLGSNTSTQTIESIRKWREYIHQTWADSSYELISILPLLSTFSSEVLRKHITVNFELSNDLLQYANNEHSHEILEKQSKMCLYYINNQIPMSEIDWLNLLLYNHDSEISIRMPIKFPNNANDLGKIVLYSMCFPNWWLIDDENEDYYVYKFRTKTREHKFVEISKTYALIFSYMLLSTAGDQPYYLRINNSNNPHKIIKAPIQHLSENMVSLKQIVNSERPKNNQNTSDTTQNTSDKPKQATPMTQCQHVKITPPPTKDRPIIVNDNIEYWHNGIKFTRPRNNSFTELKETRNKIPDTKVIIDRPNIKLNPSNKSVTGDQQILKSLNSEINTYDHLCGDYYWNGRHTRISLIAMVENYYTPEIDKYPCSYAYRITYFDAQNSNCNEFALNCKHLLAMIPILSSRTREAIKTMITGPDGYQYQLPIEYLRTLTNDLLIDSLEVLVQGLPDHPSKEADYRLPDIESNFPMNKTEAQLLWRGPEIHDRAYSLIPGPLDRSLGTIPITEKETQRSIGKRMKGRLKELDTTQINVIKALVMKDVERFPVIGGPVYTQGCFIKWVDSFISRRHLTVPQSRMFYSCAVVCEHYLEMGINSLLQLFLSQFDLATKTFIKDEIEDKNTTLRFIIAPSTYIKIILGPMFETWEHLLFYKSDSIFYNHTISGKDPETVVQMLNIFQRSLGADEVICQTDISAFEASQNGYAVDLEYIYYHHTLDPDPVCSALLNAYKMFQTSNSKIVNKLFTIIRTAMRLSGLNNTSKGNYLLNYIMMVVINGIKRFLFEGDDGVVIVHKSRIQDILDNAIFPLKLITADSVYDLSFCGYHFDRFGNKYSKTWPEFWAKLNTYFARQPLSWQKRCQIMKLRLISYQFMYPNDPNVRIAYDIYKTYWSGHEVPIDFKTYKTYTRQNWWKLQQYNIELPFMQVPELKWFADKIPTSLDELSQYDIEDIVEGDLYNVKYRFMNLANQFLNRWGFFKKFYIIFMFVFFSITRLLTFRRPIPYATIKRMIDDHRAAFIYAQARFQLGATIGLDDMISHKLRSASLKIDKFNTILQATLNKMRVFNYKRINTIYENLIIHGVSAGLDKLIELSRLQLSHSLLEKLITDEMQIQTEVSIKKVMKKLTRTYIAGVTYSEDELRVKAHNREKYRQVLSMNNRFETDEYDDNDTDNETNDIQQLNTDMSNTVSPLLPDNMQIPKT